MKHADALQIAQGLVERLRPACTRIEIAGSIRRGKAEVKDIEIVVIPDLSTTPKPPRPQFGSPPPKPFKTHLDKLLHEICLEGQMRPIKGGDKYKQFEISVSFGFELSSGDVWLVKEWEKINLDLFLVTPPAEWGVQMVIRTGPAEFSHWCVTRKSHGGALPNGYRVEDGAVWEGDTSNPTNNLIGFGEEIDFLNFLGLGWIEPGEREAGWKK